LTPPAASSAASWSNNPISPSSYPQIPVGNHTPQLKVELASVFLNALKVYEEKNVKFADAVMAFWGIDKGITTTYTYDEKDFKRIDGLTVLKP